jgi:ABC-type Na+ efflux pump permease subunit
VTLRRVLDVARHDLLDLRRQRGVWVGLLLIPFVTITFLLLLPGVLAEQEATSRARAVHRVVVQGVADGEGDAEAVAGLLPQDRFRVTGTDDARAVVGRAGADVGLVVRGDRPVADVLAAEDGQLDGEVVVLGSRTRSRTAAGAMVAALEVRGLEVTDARLAARGLAPSTVRPVVVEPVDLSETPRGRRLSLATLLPLMVLLPVASTVGVAAQRISGSKDQRVFEPLLVLPFTRRELLLGKALSAATIGSITVLAVGLPLLAGRVLPIGAGGRTVHLPAGEVLAVMGLAGVLLVVLVSLGVAVGAASRTSAELGSVLQIATLPLFLLGSLLQFRSGIVTTVPLLVAPFFGVLLCVRDVAVGALTGGHLAVAMGATVGWSAALLVVAGRLLQSERSVLRSTT